MRQKKELPILPGATIGILGSGQLGRMLAIAASRLGYYVKVYSPEINSPAGQVAQTETIGNYNDISNIVAFADSVDVLTFEFENISSAALKEAMKHTLVHPSAKVLEISQNRHLEKKFLMDSGFPVAPWKPITNKKEFLQNKFNKDQDSFDFPAILKTVDLGYDGKGQQRVTNQDQLRIALNAESANSLVLEQVINFDRELSVIGARNPQGEKKLFDIFENQHNSDHILEITHSPAQCTNALQNQAFKITSDLMEKLNLVGLICVEFFQKGEELLVNEIAPRPHNSGHLTIEACLTNQFEQHIRAICGLPLGNPKIKTPAAMLNILGDSLIKETEPNWESLFSQPHVKLHLYGKEIAKKGRKMGHLTVLSETTSVAVEQLLWVKKSLISKEKD